MIPPTKPMTTQDAEQGNHDSTVVPSFLDFVEMYGQHCKHSNLQAGKLSDRNSLVNG